MDKISLSVFWGALMNDFNYTNLKAFMLNANEFIFANQDG